MLAHTVGRRLPPALPSLPRCSRHFSQRYQSTHAVGLPETAKTLQRHHNDLPSFLAYAARTSLSPKSTAYVGTYYEYTVQRALRRLGFSLDRIGGRGDDGIDLVGTWHLPESLSRHPLRVIAQCKRLKNRLGPHIIRELEGAFTGAPTGWQGGDIFGLLVSPREATKGVREAMAKSKYPMVWLLVESDLGGSRKEAEEYGRIRQVLWNQAATESGLEGLSVTLRYETSPSSGGDALEKECVLIWREHLVLGLDATKSAELQDAEGQFHDSVTTS